MELLSIIALILLTLVGYSAGTMMAGKGKDIKPKLLDLVIVAVLWVAAFWTRPMMGKWLAVLSWVIISACVAAVLVLLRRRNYPDISAKTTPEMETHSGLKLLWERWKLFAQRMGNFQSRLLLNIFYFVIITPFGIAVRLFSDPLDIRRIQNDRNWVERIPELPDIENLQNQS